MREKEDILLQIWSDAWKAPNRMCPSEWIAEHMKLEDGTPFNFELHPWLVEPATYLNDFKKWLMGLIAPTQVGKSRLMEAAGIYWLAEDPGPIVAYQDTNDKAVDWAKQRFLPEALACKQLQDKLPADRHKVTKDQILFTHAVLDVCGANITNTQSVSRRYVLADEAWRYAHGILDNAIRRTSAPAYAGRRKVFIGSTAWDSESEVETLIEASELRVWHSNCPHCGKPHAYVLSRDHQKRLPELYPVFELRWEVSDNTYKDGVWLWENLAPTVHLACSSCGGEIKDTPTNRKLLKQSGHYRTIKGEGRESIFWIINGLGVGGGEGSDYQWSRIAQKFLQAQQLAKQGVMEPLKEVLTKTMSEPWAEEVDYDRKVNETGDYTLEKHPEAPNLWLPAWDKEKYRFLTADVQATDPYFYYVVRSWGDSGSRLAEGGTCNTWEELEDIADRHNLTDKKNAVFVDAGHDAGVVWLECAKRKWWALRGRDQDGFVHRVKTANGQVTVYKPYSAAVLRNPGFVKGGTRNFSVRCFERMWSNLTVKDTLARLTQGKGQYWGLPTNPPINFLEHLTSEKKIKEYKAWRWVQIGERPNHYWDCEGMQVVAAMIHGLLTPVLEVENDAEDASESEEK